MHWKHRNHKFLVGRSMIYTKTMLNFAHPGHVHIEDIYTVSNSSGTSIMVVVAAIFSLVVVGSIVYFTFVKNKKD